MEPNLALISRKDFGSKVDGREIGARFYGMGTDPQPIRTRLRGISADPNKKIEARGCGAQANSQPFKRKLSSTAQSAKQSCAMRWIAGRSVTREVFVVKALNLPARQAGQAGQTTTHDLVSGVF